MRPPQREAYAEFPDRRVPGPRFEALGRALCSVSIVISQQTTEPLATLNVAFVATNFIPGFDDQIIEPLMIAFLVIVIEISVHSATQRLFAEENHAFETLRFYAEVKSLQMRIQVWALRCVHGHGGNRYKVYDSETGYNGFATSLAERGYVTVAADVEQHEVFEEGRLLMGERLWDLIRCVDFLESRPEVDGDRIGCAGLSLGGEMTMWLGAMDTWIAATVSCGFLTLMDQMEKRHCMCWKFDGLRDLVDYPDIYSLVAPRALQCQNGMKEPYHQFHVAIARYAFEQIEPAYADLGKPENLDLGIHPGGHEVDVQTLLGFFGAKL